MGNLRTAYSGALLESHHCVHHACHDVGARESVGAVQVGGGTAWIASGDATDWILRVAVITCASDAQLLQIDGDQRGCTRELSVTDTETRAHLRVQTRHNQNS